MVRYGRVFFRAGECLIATKDHSSGSRPFDPIDTEWYAKLPGDNHLSHVRIAEKTDNTVVIESTVRYLIAGGGGGREWSEGTRYNPEDIQFIERVEE